MNLPSLYEMRKADRTKNRQRNKGNAVPDEGILSAPPSEFWSMLRQLGCGSFRINSLSSAHLEFQFSPVHYLLQNQLLCEKWWGEQNLQARDRTILQNPFNKQQEHLLM